MHHYESHGGKSWRSLRKLTTSLSIMVTLVAACVIMGRKKLLAILTEENLEHASRYVRVLFV